MGVIKNDVGRPSNKTIMIRRILKLILALIIVGLAVALGYFIKDKEDERKLMNKEEAEKIITRIFGEDYAYNFAMGIEAYNDKTHQTAIAIRNTKKSIKNHNLKAEFNNKVYYDAGELLFKRKDGYAYYYENNTFQYDSVNKVYKSFFGNKNDALKRDILLDYAGYLYSKESNIYAEFIPIFGDEMVTVISDVIKTDLQNDSLSITIARGIIKDEADENSWNLVLTDGTLVKVADTEIENKGTCEKYKDKLEKYKFKFILEDNIYKFVSVKKVK